MARVNLSQYQFTLSDPFKAGHVMTDLEAKILNYHRADLIRKIITRWVSDAEALAPDGILSINQLDRLTHNVAKLDADYKFSPRDEPRLPAFDYALREVAVEEVTKDAPEHLIHDFSRRVQEAMSNPTNRERARQRLVAGMKAIYGDS